MNSNEAIKARLDFNAFAELVGRDDDTGSPLIQNRMHREWARRCDEHSRLILWTHINSGSTTQLSILRTVWELGNDPTLRFFILSNTHNLARKIKTAISMKIDSVEVREVFPDLEMVLNTPDRLTVRHGGNCVDESVRIGSPFCAMSGRIDRLVLDNVLDPENTANQFERDRLELWFKASTVSRLTQRSKVLAFGSPWHKGDLLHMLANNPRYESSSFPISRLTGEAARFYEELGPKEFIRQVLASLTVR